MRPRSWSDDDLRAAVAASTRLIDVLRHLGLSIGGSTLDAVRNRILQLGLDTSHMQRAPRSPKWDADPATLRTSSRARSWSDDDLRAAVAASTSLRGVFVHLRLNVGGSQYPVLRKAIEELGLDTSHFTGKAWNKGIRTSAPGRRRPLSEILVDDSDYLWTHRLRQRLIQEGLKEACCELCGITEWQGQPVPLELDHVNGRRRDNRIENLRLLCPNCHAQTETYCGRNIGRGG